MIEIKNLCMEYKVPEIKPGIKGTIESLFNRKYKTVHALKNLSMSIETNEAMGLVGPNGAGKSTLIKLLVGVLKPTSGMVRLDQVDPFYNRMAISKNIGVVFGHRTQLWWDLPAYESFKLFKAMYKIPEEEYEKNLKYYSELLNITSFYNTPVRMMSLGQRMRCEIVAALLHSPKILLLDEPTLGLDIHTKQVLRNFLVHLRETRKCTIMIASHDMDDIDIICNKVAIINQGEIVACGCPKELVKNNSPVRQLIVSYDQELSNELPQFTRVLSQKVEKNKVTLSISTDALDLKVTLNELLESGVVVKEIGIKESNITSLISKILNVNTVEGK